MTTTKTIRVVLIEDDELTRLGLRTQIGKDPLLEVAGEAATCGDALKLVRKEQPDIILLDLNLGEESGLEFLPDLLAAVPAARVIVVTGGRDFEAHQRAISCGAMGLVLKQDAIGQVTKAVKHVYDGDVWFNRSMMLQVISRIMKAGTVKKPDPETAKIETLTGREREVINLVGEGLKNKGIAGRLYISETTVRHHLTSIFAKLGVSDRLELVIYAYRHGLATLPK